MDANPTHKDSLRALMIAAGMSLSLGSVFATFFPAYANSAKATGQHETVTRSGGKHRILIFYPSVGNGHLSAAKAIVDEYKKIDPSTEIYVKDVLDFQPELRKKLVYKFYDLVTRYTPSQYDKWYERKIKEAAAIDSLGNMVDVKRLRPDRYLQYIKDVDPTIIISTQNHITEVLHRLRDEGEIRNIPTAQVMTDYTATPYFRRLGERTEMTFVPHRAIENQFISEGLPSNKVMTTGIPVSPKVFEPMSSSDRASFLKSKMLDPKKPVIVISSGSTGIGNYQTMVESIAGKIKHPIQIVAITGRSEANRKRLEKMIEKKSLPENVTLKVLPLIPQDEMLKYLKSSEVIVGKSGGLTATEVAALGKKAVLLDIMGGQESYNSRFFEQKHLSLMTNDLNQIGTLTERLLHDKKLGDQINKAQAELRAQLKPNVVAQWIAEQRAIPLSRSNLYSLNQRKPAAEALKMSRSIKDCFITQIQIFLFQAPRVVH